MINRIKFFKKEFIFLAIAIFLAILVITSTLFVNKTKEETPQTSPAPSISKQTPFSSVQIGQARVLSITPGEKTPLMPGKTQIFDLQLDSRISPDEFNIKLSGQNFALNEKPKEISIKKSLEDKNILRIETLEAIQPYEEYQLVISTAQGKELFEANYLSDKPQPSPASNNNPALKAFLPHNTDSYTLKYQESTNSYIFSFLYNSDSNDNLQTQYDKARKDATDFIKSKGIDLSTLTIEWRPDR